MARTTPRASPTPATGAYSATYHYLANSPLVDQITFTQGTTVRMITTKNFDNLNRLSSISSAASTAYGATVASSHGYLAH